MKRLEKSILLFVDMSTVFYFSSYLPLSLSLRFFAGGGREVPPYVGYVGWLLNSFALGKGIKIRVWVQRRVFFFQEPDHYWLKILV